MPQQVSEKVEHFFSDFRLRKYTKGQVLVLNGDVPDTVFYLINGKVKVYDVTYRGDEVILNVFREGAFFPLSHAINHSPNPYIYEAQTAIEIRQAPAEQVVEFIRKNPDVMFDLVGRLYRGMDGLLGRLGHLMGGSAKSRLLYELIIECRRFGKEQPDKSIVLDVTETELAARAGLTRETVSREFNKLHQADLANLKNRSIVVTNLDLLEKHLGSEL